MAFYKRLKLPPLKLTQLPVVEASTQIIHRGRQDEHTKSEEDTINSGDCEPLLCEDSLDMPSPDDLEEPSHHELQSKASIKGWEQLRSKILSVHTECSAMPQGQLCVLCPNPAEFRCQECGPASYYCKECVRLVHEKTNFFHTPEQWKKNHYVVGKTEERRINVLPPHECSTVQSVPMCCLDDHGMEHTVQVIYCDCEPLPITSVRARLWPVTPSYPKYAFTFSLLDWVEALLLECHLSLKDFCSALYFRCPYAVAKRRNVYSCIIDAFEEYRFFKHETRHLTYLSGDLDSGNVCPACPRDKGKVVLSIDALFGLPRKRSAGVSHRDPVQGSLFFCDQSSVDEFVKTSCHPKKLEMDCNNFVAGSMLRSATRFRALDETAVFGAACRHEFPSVFLNLKHGERLSYAIYVIDVLLERHNTAEVYMMYDIACTLHKHLKLNGRTDVLERAHLCLPTFHSYGHKASCQVRFGPLRCEGVGMSDGEVMERLWSYLRCFSRMTKEMRPAHRTDVLTHALLYYGMKKKKKMCHLLVARLKKALHMKCLSEEAFYKMIKSVDGACVSEDTVQQWLAEEHVTATEDRPINPLPLWRCEYFQVLHCYYKLRDEFSQDTDVDQKISGYHEIVGLDKQLKGIEANKHIGRWTQSSKEYKEAEASFSKRKEEEVAEVIWATSSRRQFLLKLKAKYADGQKIAKKLSSQITKESRKIKALLPEYNVCRSVARESTITFEESLDPAKLLQWLPSSKPLPSQSRREAIDAYLMLRRSTEEISLLHDEIKNITHYYSNLKAVIEKCVELFSLRPDDAFGRGAVSLLQSMKVAVEVTLDECTRSFSKLGVVSRVNASMNLDTDSASDTSDSNADSDAEYLIWCYLFFNS